MTGDTKDVGQHQQTKNRPFFIMQRVSDSLSGTKDG
jgi:hypothetical protein